MTNTGKCESIEDKHRHWNKTIDQNILTKIPKLQKFTQNCSLWTIDFRLNKTYCPSVIRPDCYIMNAPNANFGCPFGSTHGSGGKTNEYCECVGLTKERMNISHSFNCTCTRNLSKGVQTIKGGTKCYDFFQFQKTCVIHWPYDVRRRNKTTKQMYTATRYHINCTFVDCFDKQDKELIHLTGLNGTCSNERTTTLKPETTKIASSKTPPTTSKTTTTITSTRTTCPSTTRMPTTKTKTISTPKITSIATTEATTRTTPTVTTKKTYVTTPHASISTVFQNISNSTKQLFTVHGNFKSIYSNLKVSKEDLGYTLNNPSTELAIHEGKLGYSTQTNQGPLVGIMLLMTFIQLCLFLATGVLAKTRRGQNFERKLREKTRRE